ncbi:MAG: 3-keto-disaccharide hydrolase [Roseibacillus sp.]
MKSLLLTLLLAAPAIADHHKEAPVLPAGLPSAVDTAALEKDGFKNLFNGKDLTGWRKTGGTAEYEPKGDSIRGFGKDVKGNTFLRTEDEFGDFIFAFQFKFNDKTGNSGCMFRGLHKEPTEKDPDGRVTGYQCEHDNFKAVQRSWTAGIFDEARRGWLDPAKNATDDEKAAFTAQGEKLFKWDGWNTIVIKCQGNQLQTWLNGEQRANFTDTDEEHTTLKGFIALQVHSGKSGDILWKNLYLKEL